MAEIPRIISVDDHVVEPPTLWTDRLPNKYKNIGPRVERDLAIFHFEGGVFSYEKGKDAAAEARSATGGCMTTSFILSQNFRQQLVLMTLM